MTISQMESPTVQISSGVFMPFIGFGTFPMRGPEARKAVREALTIGYRCVDTAMRYKNEAAVGEAVAESGIERARLFITSKMAADQVGFEQEALESSLRRLQIEYLDLWLIHWPPGLH